MILAVAAKRGLRCATDDCVYDGWMRDDDDDDDEKGIRKKRQDRRSTTRSTMNRQASGTGTWTWPRMPARAPMSSMVLRRPSVAVRTTKF